MKIREDIREDFFERGFTSETDPFERADLAERLTKLYSQLDHGTVSVLDGRWGSGKSIFARQWKFHLERSGIPCIYFDAFSADYIDSPFRAVASAFVREAKAAKAYDNASYDRFLSAASKTAKIIAAPAAKMVVKAVTLGLVGSAEMEEIKAVAEEVASGLGDVSDTAVKAMLEEQAGDEANFAALRESLETLPNLLAKKLFADQSRVDEVIISPSLVVIIDELDRCRPDFALGVMEVLKHFFRADRVHFILITNLSHLLLSVQKRYGVGDAAGEYVQKFYDFLIPFEERQNRYNRSTNASIHASRLLNTMMTGLDTMDGRNLAENVLDTIKAYDLSLRQAERVVANVILAQIDFNRNTYRPGFLVSILAAMKSQNPSLFSEIKRGRINTHAVLGFVEAGDWPGRTSGNRILNIVRYHADPDIDEKDPEFDGFGSWLGRFNFDDRLEILPYLANSVIDRFG